MNYHISDVWDSRDSDMPAALDVADNAQYVFRHADEPLPPVGMESLGLHYHTCYELLYFLRGDADYWIEQSRYSLQPHTLMIIKPGEYHAMLVNSSKRLERIVIHFSDKDLPLRNREILGTLDHAYCIPGTRLSEEILQVDTYYHDLAEGIPKEVLVNQLQIILAFLCNIQDKRRQADHIPHAAECIISYIHGNLATIHSLDDICQNVHMSRSAVQNHVSEYLQTPVMAYVRTQKCVYAKSLIQKGLSATEAAMCCGFADYSSFYRAYKKTFGAAPTDEIAQLQTISVQ